WHAHAAALDRLEHGRRGVQVEGIAELVGLRRLRRLDAGRKLVGLVAAEGRAPPAAERFLERLVAEEIEAFRGDLEARLGGEVGKPPSRALLGEAQVPLFDQALDQPVDEPAEIRSLEPFLEIEDLLQLLERNHRLDREQPRDRLAQLVERELPAPL